MNVTPPLVALVLLVGAQAPSAQSVELTVIAPASLRATEERIGRIDHAWMARALAAAGLELPSPVRIILVAPDQPAALDSPPWVVGRAFGTDTMVIYPDRIGAYPYDSLEAVVIHEMTHLALTARAGGRSLPRWFHEGVAVSVESGWGFTSQLRLLIAARQDPAVDEVSRLFASESLPANTTAYLLSAALVEDVRRRHGLHVPGAIAAGVAAGLAFENAFAAVTRETPDQAAAVAWRVYRGLRWLPVLTGPTALWGGILLLAVLAFAVRMRRRFARRRQWDAEERAEEQPILRDHDPDA